jgi:hypothetical protein
LFLIYLAVYIAFFIAVLDWLDNVLNLLENSNYLLSFFRLSIFLSELFAVFLVFKKLVSNDEGLIFPLFNGLYDFFLRILNQILKIHFFDFLKDWIVQLKLVLFLHKKRTANSVIDRNVAPKPWMIFNLVYFDPF